MKQKLMFPFLLVGHNAWSLTIKSLRKIRWDTTWTYWSIELSHHGGRGKYHHNGGLCIGRTATSIQSNPMILPPHSSRAHTHTHTHTHTTYCIYLVWRVKLYLISWKWRMKMLLMVEIHSVIAHAHNNNNICNRFVIHHCLLPEWN